MHSSLHTLILAGERCWRLMVGLGACLLLSAMPDCSWLAWTLPSMLLCYKHMIIMVRHCVQVGADICAACMRW